MEISVVIPVYGCRKALPELHKRLTKTLLSITEDFEIVLVDDCDKQNSWEEIEVICKQDKRVQGIHLSKNFGQPYAITAGLDNCSGNWIVVMDCDLQDRPEFIRDLYVKAQEGYDVVFARRVQRKDSKLTLLLSKSFYKVYDYLCAQETDNTIGNFSISKRIVIENYCKMREHKRTYQMFIRWLGFKQTSIDLAGDDRFEGESSYTFKKKLKFAINSITTQSNRPLYISISVGFACAFFSAIYILFLIGRYFVSSVPMGWTTIVASIFLMGGLILAFMGILGIYIGNIYDEVKNRPIYVIKEHLNQHNK